MDLLDGETRQERVTDCPDAIRVGRREPGLDLVFAGPVGGEPEVLLIAAEAEPADATGDQPTETEPEPSTVP